MRRIFRALIVTVAALASGAARADLNLQFSINNSSGLFTANHIQILNQALSRVEAMWERAITGYQAGEQLDLKWHNVNTVGNALDGLVQQGGATRISVSFGLNDPKAAQAEARSLAIADAKTRAAAMAKAAGVSLGQVLRITDSTQVYRPPQYNFAPSAAAIDQTQLPVGSMDIQVSVEMSFAIA